MKFNHFVWELYKNSDKGKDLIELFTNISNNIGKIQELQKKITDGKFSYSFTIDFSKISEKKFDEKKLIDKFGSDKLTFNIIESIAFHYQNNLKISSIKEIYNIYDNIKNKGIDLYHKNIQGKMEFVCYHKPDEYLLIDRYSIAAISIGLYLAYPEYFFPYLFNEALYKVEQICEEFNIPFPEIPLKNDIAGRSKFYFDLCIVFYEFRKNLNLTSEEFCSFLYGFAPNFIENTNDISDLPLPSKVWIIGGGINNNGDFEYLDKINNESRDTWNGNIETRKGDIVIMYCLSPRSYIHSIWRAVHDGYVEPYFHWYAMIEIAFPQKVIPITFKELLEDEIFSKKGLVKAHMIGVNGKGLSVTEYHHLLEMLKYKGQDISLFPRIEKVGDYDNENLENERDVEIKLIEPLIKRLEYKESDWIRQMPLRMGRGIRYYPDYVFGAVQKKGEENAKMIIESKYQISNEKELFEAYYQAKSYALRLSTQYFIVASKEGIWIFDKEEILSKYNYHKTWNDLLNPDIFHEVLIKIGRNKIL